MKYLYPLSFVIMLLFSGCEQEEVNRGCNVRNPLQEIGWLKERVNEVQKSSGCQFVQQGRYEGKIVFVFGTCDPNVNSINAVYDCEGNLLCFNGDETCPDFNEEVKELQVVWTKQS